MTVETDDGDALTYSRTPRAISTLLAADVTVAVAGVVVINVVLSVIGCLVEPRRFFFFFAEAAELRGSPPSVREFVDEVCLARGAPETRYIQFVGSD